MTTTDCGPIFVVGANADDRALISGPLERAGFATRETDSGEEALRAARRERPALIILEVVLPGASGYEICRRFRDEFGQGLPLIFVSGDRTDPLDQAAGLLIGADDYITKPFLPDTLLARVRRLLERSRQFAPLEPSLTSRERKVLSLLAAGLRKCEIAGELVISPSTVGKHIEHILSKLNVHSQAQAVAVALRDGLVETFQPAPAQGVDRRDRRRQIPPRERTSPLQRQP